MSYGSGTRSAAEPATFAPFQGAGGNRSGDSARFLRNASETGRRLPLVRRAAVVPTTVSVDREGLFVVADTMTLVADL